ncbi:hypothetical protein SAI_1108, partial [Streptococcus agalactiae H36B]
MPEAISSLNFKVLLHYFEDDIN